MIPRVQTGGSFKGAGLYYLHDKKRDGETERLTTDRVAWTHAVNTLENDPTRVLTEMQVTSFYQQQLKMDSGNRIDGRPTDKPVMTIALAWSPEQQPSHEDMIAAGHSYLKHMGWNEHQALFVAHNDTKHPHMHVILNTVHPETGMALDASWTKNRSHQWALKYEREQGQVLCAAREGKYETQPDLGKPSGSHMNRAEWTTWQTIQKNARVDDREFAEAIKTGEWQSLKSNQQDERKQFWKETGQQRKDVRDEVRGEIAKEFSPQWKQYADTRSELEEQHKQLAKETARAIKYLRKYKSVEGVQRLKEEQERRRDAMREQLAELRRDIGGRQKERIEELATPALDLFAVDRRSLYAELLTRQRGERTELQQDQAAGIRRRDVLDRTQIQASNQNAPPRTPAPYVEAAKAQTAQERAARGAGEEITRAPAALSVIRPPAQPGPQLTDAQREQAERLRAMRTRAEDRSQGRGEMTDRRQASPGRELTDAQREQFQRLQSLKQSERERGLGGRMRERDDGDGGRGGRER